MSAAENTLPQPDMEGYFAAGSSSSDLPAFRVKTALDRVLSALLLVPALPVMAALILLVRATSPGPGIFRQMRVGKGGKLFWMMKIRSMRSDAEASTGAVWTSKGDPRITGLGKLLRKTHLDELPQLINVLRGDMSLVGPRPERPEFVEVLSESIPGYRDRQVVRPGITGLAQINLPPDSDLNSVRMKQVLDLEYISSCNVWLDLRILLCTFLRIVGLSGNVAMKVACVVREVQLDDLTYEYYGDSLAGTPDAVAEQHMMDSGLHSPDTDVDQTEVGKQTVTFSLEDTQEGEFVRVNRDRNETMPDGHSGPMGRASKPR